MARSLTSLVLALSLSLGALGTTLPVARACGSYGPPISAEDRAAIEDVVGRHFFHRFDDPTPHVDFVMRIDDVEADVWVSFDDGSPMQIVTVHTTEHGWQVTSE